MPNAQNFIKRKIMLFDLDVRGHHASYIKHLITYWHNNALPGILSIVVVSRFGRLYPDIIKLAESSGSINFVTVTSEEEASLKTVSNALERMQRSFQEWRLIEKYIKITKCDRCLLMFLDSLLWRISIGIKPPCPISSIFFRPISHYRNFDNYKPSSRERFWELREKIGLSGFLASKNLSNFFCLDPLAVDYLSKKYRDRKVNIIHLPDPVKKHHILPKQVENSSQNFEIEAGRRVFLLFGSLAKRKGIHEVLEAIKLLPTHLCQKFCLMLIGEVEGGEYQKQAMKLEVANIRQSLPVQIVEHYKYVSDEDMQLYFSAADVVLAPYQRHVGMSGIIVQAAAAMKPVLSSDYGLMGKITRDLDLGITVNSEKPTSITNGIIHCLTNPEASFCNYEQMKYFSEQNGIERFCEVIFESIFL